MKSENTPQITGRKNCLENTTEATPQITGGGKVIVGKYYGMINKDYKI